MRILLVTPAGSGTRVGNRITALRMAGLLRSLGHEVKLRGDYEELGADAMIALHAQKSAQAILEASECVPPVPTALVLTGTDIYGETALDSIALRSLRLARRIVILQPRALEQIPKELQSKTRLVLQSAKPPGVIPSPDREHFEVCVLAHLRPVKDPLLAARAARRLPASSHIRIVHVGSALDEASRKEAELEEGTNPRYHWLGPRRYAESLRILARSRVLVLSSQNEGGPAVVTEALACGTPVLATRIPAAEALLGREYPGLYPVGDEEALAALLLRCETEPSFLAELRTCCLALRDSVRPEREAADLARLLEELVPG